METTTIDVQDRGYCDEYFSGTKVDPEWHFYILNGITLASTNLQLTFDYSIGYGNSDDRTVLAKGIEVFSVNLE